MDIELLNKITIETVDKVAVLRTSIDHKKEVITYFLTTGKLISCSFSDLPSELVDGFKAISSKLIKEHFEKERLRQIEEEEFKAKRIASVMAEEALVEEIKITTEIVEESVEEVLPPIATETPVTPPDPII